jgi:hypothetical protein
MQAYIQILAFVIIGIVLLWFGYTLLIGQLAGSLMNLLNREKPEKNRPSGTPGDAQVCPVCSARLDRGQLVKSQAFPSLTGGKDRLMYIRGCVYCINGNRPRICPVCGDYLFGNDFLISRMFERPHRSHVHVTGCSRCKHVGSLLK